MNTQIKVPFRTLSFTYMGRSYPLPVNMPVERASKIFDRLNSVVNCVVGAANTIAGKALYDLMEDTMPEHPKLWRLQTKYWGKIALKQYKAYESAHYKNFGDRYSCFIDYLDCIEEDINEHVETLYWSIKAVFDKAGDPQSELHAKVERVYTLLDISIGIYDKMLELTEKETGINFRPVMDRARLDSVSDAFNKFRCLLMPAADKNYKPKPGDRSINLADDPNCQMAAKIIIQRLSDEDVLDRACQRAVSYHPELADKYSSA